MNPDFEHIELLVDGILETLHHSLTCLDEVMTRELIAAVGQYNFNKEHRTIKFQLPRRTGNSRILLRLFQRLQNAVILTNTERTKGYLVDNNIPQHLIFTKVDEIVGIKPDVIIVDNASWTKPEIIEELYKLHGIKYFILIG